jgi:hypothetical protein
MALLQRHDANRMVEGSSENISISAWKPVGHPRIPIKDGDCLGQAACFCGGGVRTWQAFPWFCLDFASVVYKPE